MAKYKPYIIAVTGSVGKTSTKDAVFSIVRHASSHVRKSEKSMNSEIGLPLTIIGAPNAWKDISGWIKNITDGLELIFWKSEYPDTLVLEIGADHPGDIRKVAKWLRPDIAIITKISDTPVHVEFFESPTEVFKEKSYLAHAVKDGGTLILFGDDKKVSNLGDEVIEKRKSSKKNINVESLPKIIKYGIISKADIQASNVQIDYIGGSSEPIGMKFDLYFDGKTLPVKIGNVLGNSYIYALLAAAACGKTRGMLSELILQGINEFRSPNGRMNIIKGVNGSIIIDDTYNSSPDAVESALSVLASIQCAGRKIVAFGDMMELGRFTSEEHRKAGLIITNVASKLVTVGPRSNLSVVEGAAFGGMNKSEINCFDSSVDAGKYLASIIQKGDIVLVKGSQSNRMERVVKEIMLEPNRSGELLVRQEKEWLLKK